MRALFLLALFVSLGLQAQTSSPKVSGKVKISIQDGTFDCDLTLSDYPQVSDYFIKIHRGMNVRNFQSVQDNPFVLYHEFSGKDSPYESTSYYFPNNKNDGKFLPKKIRVRYSGKYPVVRDTLGDSHPAQDWKGNIAFNGKTVRADGMQTAWYPVFQNVLQDQSLFRVRYDIEIECADCTTLFVNGSQPVKAQKHRFISETPQEMALFCGDYDFSFQQGTFLLNPDLTQDQLGVFLKTMNGFKEYYQSRLGIPYGSDVTFIRTTPVSANNSWMFVSYPSIFTIDWGKNGMQTLFHPENGVWYASFLAHELGHYYFGTLRDFNSPLGDMMSEGLAEYLSLKALENFYGTENLKKKMQYKKEQMKDFNPTLFSKVKTLSDYNNRELYVYYYAPTMFYSIERIIGEERMFQWMKLLLTEPVGKTDYTFLLKTLKQAVGNAGVYDQIKKEILENPKFLQTQWSN